MRKLALASIALAGLGSAFAVPAHADVSDPGPGLICQFASVTDPTAEAGTQTGELSGGPLVIQNDDGTPGSGTLTCRIQVTVSNHTGTGPSVSGHGTGVVTAGPSEISYTASATDNVYLCGEFTTDAGVTLYWDDTSASWSVSASVSCGLAIGGGGDDPLSQFEKDNIDPLICPILAGLPSVPGVVDIGADGDLYVAGIFIWDCPPYVA